MRSGGYNTKSKQMILDFLQEYSDKTVTVSEISEYLERNDNSVNLTTIYRYLDKLVLQGLI
ncbi:MAG: transcriptional repressor, partial [Oscillospiraceae bacterium]